ncbi:hypothetical protein Tsubulata_014960 [Turnera subulata]|uniref:Uncharacterized protein n=1 Tax=Turnera subulata TaxID=218843 RepID=A0A9Q0J3T7_9ROSI|nr:hypothetical protein Tsubulata_014960 [Turnera subulata]
MIVASTIRQIPFLPFLLALLAAGDGFSDEEIVDFLMALLVAGYETTSTIMTLAVKFLTETPLALAQLNGRGLCGRKSGALVKPQRRRPRWLYAAAVLSLSNTTAPPRFVIAAMTEAEPSMETPAVDGGMGDANEDC